jgi:hypothetical protein
LEDSQALSFAFATEIIAFVVTASNLLVTAATDLYHPLSWRSFSKQLASSG